MASMEHLEAEAHFHELLERVEHGESLTINRGGQAIAELVPAPHPASPDRDAVIRELLDFGERRKLNGISIRERRGRPQVLTPLVVDASVTAAWCN